LQLRQEGHYNYFRDYDPGIGRYVQSDPTGLEGGFNTYAYVLGDPLRYTDKRGEKSVLGFGAGWIGGCAGYGFISAMYGYTPSSGGGAGGGGGSDDKKRHCYATCRITKCSLWIPFAPIAIGLGKEILDHFTGSGFDSNDMAANMYGLRKAYLFSDCEQECNQCPIK
jgi:hypothetical protein